MEASRKEWEHIAIITLSLGWMVPLEWVAKEVKEKRKLQYDVEAFALTKDHLLQFQSVANIDTMLSGGPLFVTAQLLMMEP
ncbi:hypothetical protein COCNU_09G001260 [Cocos nucifera]|uniref:Uncharacterized protein n=1 Tax=Cocos nucifera TaxID=13894 RepID=A0A8K0N708_COCNU|nr:hypothetical protein COCNU_09G001260 [Cocos nucifera]